MDHGLKYAALVVISRCSEVIESGSIDIVTGCIDVGVLVAYGSGENTDADANDTRPVRR
jgi:hypothetical protein